MPEITEEGSRHDFKAFERFKSVNSLNDNFSIEYGRFDIIEMTAQPEYEYAIKDLNVMDFLGRTLSTNKAPTSSKAYRGGWRFY